MAGNHKRRKRTIDVEKMSPEQAQRTADQLSGEINKIMKNAYDESNKLLNIFGMKLEYGFEIMAKDEKAKVSKNKDKSQSLK